MDEITAPRKLTNDETGRLRSLLKSKLKIHRPAPEDHDHDDDDADARRRQSEEDASDLLDYAFAMIANGKDARYVANELRSMEMEVCDGDSAEMLGRALAKFLGDLTNAESGGGGGGAVKGLGGSAKPPMALSGALGASRAPANNYNVAATAPRRGDGDRNGRGGGGGGSFGGGRTMGLSSSIGARGGGGGGGGGGRLQRPPPRSLHGAAFDRLIPPPPQYRRRPPTKDGSNDLSDPRDYGNNNGNNSGRGGRAGMPRGNGARGDRVSPRDQHLAGRGGGSDRDQNSGRGGGGLDQQSGGRGGGGSGGGRGVGGRMSRGEGRNPHDLAGRRRGREEDLEREEDFIPAAHDRGLNSINDGGGRMGRVGGRAVARVDRGRGSKGRGAEGGREGDRGRGNRLQQQQHTKRPRYEDHRDGCDYAGQRGGTGGGEGWGDKTMTESLDTQRQGRGVGGVEGGFHRGHSLSTGRGHNGGRGGRGAGRFLSTFDDGGKHAAMKKEGRGGENESAFSAGETDTATKEAAAVSESPLIAATFGGGFYRGGRRGGVGRGGRGRGAGRTEVAELISAMTWKRPRTMDEGLSTSR
jgi:hypothetical protein